MPFRTAFPETGSICDSSARMLLLAPACAAATVSLASGSSCPQPCGMLTTPGHHRVGDLDRDHDRAGAPSVTCAGSPSASPSRCGVVGVHVQRCSGPCPPRAFGMLCIQELFERSWRRPTSTMPPLRLRASAARRRSTSATIGSGASSIRAARRAQHLRQPRLQRAQVDAVRAASSCVERQAVRVGAEAVAVGAGAQHEVEQALGPARGSERGHQLRPGRGPRRASAGPAASRRASSPATMSSSASTSASGPWPAAIAGQPQQHLPLGHRVRPELEQRRRVVGDVAHRELVEREVVVRALRAAGAAGRITSAWRVVSLR